MRVIPTAAFLLLWSLVQHTMSFTTPTFGRPASLTQQWAKKVKRGKLGQVAAGGIASTPKSKTKKTTKKAAAGGAVSPALAEWASSDDSNVVSPDLSSNKDTLSEETTFTKFQKEPAKSSRRKKQSARKAQDQERDAAVTSTIASLETLLKEKSGATLEDILGAIRPFLSLPSSESLRVLTATKNQSYNYRLAWVGGDDALCHIGTGLHKVALARMQEVFLTLQGRSRIELLEVIRILGPFPNVRNTLQGDCKVSSSERVTDWEIVMDSMVDGTGKEILAGTEDNIRRVNLQVYFCDANAILAVVPPESGAVRTDPLEDNGAHVLLFVREDEMDTELEKLRVS